MKLFAKISILIVVIFSLQQCYVCNNIENNCMEGFRAISLYFPNYSQTDTIYVLKTKSNDLSYVLDSSRVNYNSYSIYASFQCLSATSDYSYVVKIKRGNTTTTHTITNITARWTVSNNGACYRDYQIDAIKYKFDGKWKSDNQLTIE